MSDGKADAAGEKLQFSGGVSVIEIGQSHLPAAADDSKDKAAAAPAPAAAADKAEPKAADAKADSPAADNKAAAAEPISAKADAPSAGSEKVTPKPDASPAAAQTPSASAAPAEPKSASHATEKKNGTTEPVTPNSPSTPAASAPGADAKVSDAKGDAKADAKKADDKPKEKKKEKKDAKPVRDVNPALAARVKAANQYNRKWKAAKDAGLNDEEVAAAAAGGERRGTKVQADSKTPAAAAGTPVVVTETEAERMRRERREKKDRLNLAEKVSAYHVDAMDPDLEAKVAAHEYADDTTAAPSVADLLKDNEKQGVMEERSSALIGYNWTPHTCVIHGGHFYWIKDEKKDVAAAGRVKFVKAKVRVEINDSVLELYDPDVPKKALQTRHFRVPETSGDFVDAWLLAIKRAKLKYYKAKGAQLLKEEEKQRKESGNPAPSAAVLSPQAAKAAALAAKRKAAQQMLTRGIQLMKHQAGTRYARAVWCTPQMDRVCWGDPKMDTVKGFVLLDDIIEVADHIALPMKPGAYGIAIAHNLHAFSGTDEAVLQFECDDSHARDAWVAALRAFTDKPN